MMFEALKGHAAADPNWSNLLCTLVHLHLPTGFYMYTRVMLPW